MLTYCKAAVLFEDEIRRGRLAAEEADRDRNLLSRKRAIQTYEALEIESRFRRMADLAPVGMFHIDPAGVLIYANNNYYAYVIDDSLCACTDIKVASPNILAMFLIPW